MSNDVGASSSRGASALPASGPLVHASQDLDDFQASFWRYQMDLVEQAAMRMATLSTSSQVSLRKVSFLWRVSKKS